MSQRTESCVRNGSSGRRTDGAKPECPVLVTNLRGGLGNQMFQYACGRALAADGGLSLRIAADMLELAATSRAVELQRAFYLEVPSASRAELALSLGVVRSHPYVRLLLEKPGLNWLRGPRFILETGVGKSSSLLSVARNGAYLHGYWQSERYFAHQSDLIRTEYRFREPLLGRNAEVKKRICAGPSASLHVRRGDYLLNPKTRAFHGACSREYYIAAITSLSREVPDLRWFAFSDEPQWVAEALQPVCPGLEIIDHNSGNDSIHDMHLMSLCDHHVIANSSFSWWGAWLNPSQAKKVIAPRQWFAGNKPSGDLVPEAWLKI